MSTNYYMVKRCDHCKHEERLHIGQSSMGWCFALATHPDAGITNLDDWRRKFADEDTRIEDEYGEGLTADDMLSIITQRRRGGNAAGPDAWSVLGPNGLRRAKVDGTHCIGHGEGTWDLYAGDFS